MSDADRLVSPGVDEGAPMRERRGAERGRRRRTRRRRTLVALVLCVVVIGGFVAFYELEANPLGGLGAREVVTIATGDSAAAVIGRLAQRGIVGSTFAFKVSELLHGTPTVVPGAYLFQENASFSVVRQTLANGPDVFDVDVPAGFSLVEVERRVADLPIPTKGSFVQDVGKAAGTSAYSPPTSPSLEGAIGTGTYQVLPHEPSGELLAQMTARFDKQAQRLGLGQGAQALGITPSQLVIVASIVQKEGFYDKNMGKVARVIYNRLSLAQPLQMDSTILYSLGKDGGPVTPADLKIDTPYNTYLHKGLPPTAICTPSIAALDAAAHPTPGAWLYFTLVSKDGTEQFSDTFPGQLAAEALARSRGLP
ncbi:MAG: endolytic transglycosylase MltG [Acidimicrobiales bacterium]